MHMLINHGQETKFFQINLGPILKIVDNYIKATNMLSRDFLKVILYEIHIIPSSYTFIYQILLVFKLARYLQHPNTV